VRAGGTYNIYSVNLDEVTDSIIFEVRLKQTEGGVVVLTMWFAIGCVFKYQGISKMYFQFMCSVCSSKCVLKRMGCGLGVVGVMYECSCCFLSSCVLNRGSRNGLV